MRIVRPEAPTKGRLLDAAERLMLAKGFVATTVDEICEAAKLTKGSFFHYFETKEALGRELLARFCTTSQEQMQGACCQEREPLKRIRALLEFMIKASKEGTDSQGCLLGTFAQELSDTNPAMRQLCAAAFERWTQALKKDLDAARAKYAPKATFDSESLAKHFIAVVEGAKILAKAEQDDGVVEASVKHFGRYVESLLKR